MADEADLADMQQGRLMDAAIQNARKKADFNVNGTGECRVCGSTVEPKNVGGKLIVGRWCSNECRDVEST